MANTKEQKENPQELGDTSYFERLCPENNIDHLLNINQIKRPCIINWFKRQLSIFKPSYRCQKCDREYSRLPTKKEFRFDCRTPGCYWMIFSDGTQTHDYPGE